MLLIFTRKFHWALQLQRLSSSSVTMVRVLNVAEKNDAAKSLADVLSRGRFSKREGFSKFNKIYEFDYRFLNQQVKMSMTSVSGHLLGLEFVGLFKKWNSCNPVDLFSVPVEKYCPQQFMDIKKTLEREVKSCQSLIIWTDGDREGENIGYEIIEVCQAVKPNIKIYRAKFSEITPHAIERAINNLGPPDSRINDAVNVRQELDLRIGAAFTRFQTLRLKKIFPEALAEQLISYGSCQFPTLGFVVERYKQVQQFIPEPFWKIKVSHISDEVQAEFSWKRNRTFDYQACQALYDQCIDSPVATVIDVKSKSKSKWRPQPLDTVELEKLASRKLKVNAKETMKIAEKLYTQGFISYPRTETNIFPKELNLSDLVQEQATDPNWGEFAVRVLENGPNPRNGSKTDNAHPPIHPLKYTNSLQGNEQKIYEFIVRHFLACVSQDAQGHETVVEIDISQEKFSAQGLMILARNYLEVYPYEKWNAKEIPLYYQGDQFEPNSIEILAGETTPPPLLSEADLIALMDKHGIGTDATHADHIETVKSRLYVGLRPDGKFVPGHLGMGLVEGYDSMGYEMSKPNLRAELEADLKLICDGHKLANDVLQVQIGKYKEVFVEAIRQAQKLDEALSVYLGEAKAAPDNEEEQVITPSIVMNCPRCGQPMVLRTKKDGKGFYIGCARYPDCKATIWLPEIVLHVSITDEICQRCHPGPVKKLLFKFKPHSVPPTISTNHTGCIGGCDEMLNEVLGIRPITSAFQDPNIRTSTPNSRQNGTSTNSLGLVNTSKSHNIPPNSRSIHLTSPSVVQAVRTENPRNSNRSTATPFHNGSTSGQSQTMGHKQKKPFSSPLSSIERGQSNSVQRGIRVDRQDQRQGPEFHPAESSWGRDNRGSSNQDKAIVCGCGSDAILLTVRKEGPNTGRQFYKCSGQTANNCNFFLWADEESKKHSSPSSSSSQRVTVQKSVYDNIPMRSKTSINTEDVLCKCGQSAKILTVQKIGPNTGRQFYACCKPREESCGFFQWAEPGQGDVKTFEPKGNSSGAGYAPFQPRPDDGTKFTKRKRPSLDGEGPKQRKPPCCSYCGQPGHKKPSCPERTSL